MIRIGLCQCKLSFEQPEENLAMMERFLLCAWAAEGNISANAECGPARADRVRGLSLSDYAHGLERGEKAGSIQNAAKKVDLLLFPELTLTGFTMKSSEFAIPWGSQMTERVREMAVRYGIAIGFGCVMEVTDLKESCAPEKEGDRLTKSGLGECPCDGVARNPAPSGDRPEKSDLRESSPKNTYLIINKEGELLADYAKLHPFSYAGENCHYSPGNALGTFTLNDVRFGVTVCYDLRFPEIYQAYADTCDAIIVAANWPAKRAEHWNALLKARAIETQCYMAAVNCVGLMDGQYYQGDSQVIEPDGGQSSGEWEKLAAEEGILFADVDEKRVMQARTEFPVRQDRRNALYCSLHAPGNHAHHI